MPVRAGARTYKYAPPKGARAFSLVEVMVAVGLLGVIIVGLLAMFYQTQRAFRTGMTQVDVLEGGRATMELIARDLQESTYSLPVIVTNVQINFVSRLPIDLPGGGQAVLTIYDVSFLRRFNDEWIGERFYVNATNGVGTLYRLLVSSNLSDLDKVLTATLEKRGTNFTPIVDGIVHFRVTPFDGRGLPFPPTNSPTLLRPDAETYLFYSNGLPSFYEIELAVLEPKALEQLRVRGNQAKALAYLRNQAGRIHFFKQRVPVRNGPAYFAQTNVLAGP